MSEPKVWSIPLITLVVNNGSAGKDQIEVIEKSAYDELKAENEKLKKWKETSQKRTAMSKQDRRGNK